MWFLFIENLNTKNYRGKGDDQQESEHKKCDRSQKRGPGTDPEGSLTPGLYYLQQSWSERVGSP